MAEPDTVDTAAWLLQPEPLATAACDSWAEAVPGRLRPVGEIGRGGMATVEVAVDEQLDRRVARKVIRRELGADRAARQLFAREAKLTGRLTHPHIAPVYDVGMTTDGLPYFTMQLVQGRPLSEVLATQRTQPLDDATVLFDMLTVATKICDAVAFAHQHGVLHGDIKPHNVMIGEFGAAYLMDWGIAREIAAERDGGGATVVDGHDGAVLGTPAYMSPEQARGLRDLMGPTADVFSLGALIFEMLSGRPPYVASSAEALLELARAGAVPRLGEVVDAVRVPVALEQIVARATACEPSDRYPTAQALRDDLVAFMRGRDLPRRRFLAGDVIVREGERGETAYVIDSGLCEAYREVRGEHVTLRRMGPGEVFGEMAILNAEPRTATVVAVHDTVLREVTAELLAHQLDALEPWMSALVRSLAERFRELERTGTSSPAGD